jgi:hypothetical protein
MQQNEGFACKKDPPPVAGKYFFILICKKYMGKNLFL